MKLESVSKIMTKSVLCCVALMLMLFVYFIMDLTISIAMKTNLAYAVAPFSAFFLYSDSVFLNQLWDKLDNE